MAQNVSKDEKEILQDPEGDKLPLPPYWMMIPPASITTATGCPTGVTSPRWVRLPDSSKVPTAPQVVELPPSPTALTPALAGSNISWKDNEPTGFYYPGCCCCHCRRCCCCCCCC